MSLTGFVDPLIGTDGVGFGVGSLNPGVQVPFGALHAGTERGGRRAGERLSSERQRRSGPCV